MGKNKIAIIGGGIAGLEAANNLISMGFEIVIIEKNNHTGGHVADWYHLFPNHEPAQNIISELENKIRNKAEIQYGTIIKECKRFGDIFKLELENGVNTECNAIIVATGYNLFDAAKKEEYGYKIYDNVITSADLESKFKAGETVKTKKGEIPKRIAMIHCVGSRDEKAGNTYCSKVCCVTGVKQAIELKQYFPNAEIYSFYMDLRMYDRHFEDMYCEAQLKYGIRFIRGRLSEACENQDGSILVKAEDTLTGKPLKMSVDLVVLLVGMEPAKDSEQLSGILNLEVESDKFFKPLDNHLNLNITSQIGVFIAGTCSGPKSVAETIADARSAAFKAACYVNGNCN